MTSFLALNAIDLQDPKYPGELLNLSPEHCEVPPP